MRILFFTQNFQPEPNFKGLPLAKSLRDMGHEVEILTGFPNYPGGKIYKGYRIRPWKREILDGIGVIRVPLYPSHSRSGIRRIFSYLSFGIASLILGPSLVKKPDVIYVYNLITLGPAWQLMRFLYGSKVVLDILDLWPESVTSSGMLRSRWGIWLLSKWCKFSYRSANRLIVPSLGIKNNLVARGLDKKKMDVVYNWCDESQLVVPEPDEADTGRLGFANCFNVVFAGTMGVVQSLDSVLEAAKIIATRFHDVKFTFIGGGVEVDYLKGIAASLDNVQFLPQVALSEIGSVLANADALLVHLKPDPVFEITIPSKIQAYLHAGKPILCGVRGNAASLVQESGGGVCFEPCDAHSLVDAIRSIRQMTPSARKEMGLRGQRFYRDRLSFAIGSKQIESVLHRAMVSDV